MPAFTVRLAGSLLNWRGVCYGNAEMTSTLSRVFALILLACLLAPTAQAQMQRGGGHQAANVWYVGIGGGRGELRETVGDDIRFDDADTARMAFIGTRGQVLGLEAQALRFDSFESEGEEAERVSLQGRTVSASLNLQLDPRFSLYGRWGRFWWRADSGETEGLPDGSSSDRFRGLGALVRVSPRVDLMLEYQRFRVDDINPRLTSLSVALRF